MPRYLQKKPGTVSKVGVRNLQYRKTSRYLSVLMTRVWALQKWRLSDTGTSTATAVNK